MKKKKIRESAASRAFSVLNITILLLFTFLCAYPFYYMLLITFSDPERISEISFFAKGFTLKNYMSVFAMESMARATIVSVARTVIGTASSVLCTVFFGYLLTKQTMVGRKIISKMLLITMYVGGGLIPTFLVYNAYGLMNSYLIYIVPGLFSAYNCILAKTFIEQLPASLEESAMLDGAGPVQSFCRIVFPLAKPIVATLAVFSAVGHWNSWFDTHIYITDSSKWTLQYVLYRYLNRVNAVAAMMEQGIKVTNMDAFNIPSETARMTMTAVATIPIMLVYPFAQKYFMKGLLVGAVKG